MPFCFYFSIYACDNKVTAIKSDGAPAKLQMAANTAHCTQILSIDLDNVTHEEYLKYKFMLTTAELFTVDVFTGHGYQMHLLLDKPTTDLIVLDKWLNAVRNYGVPADEKVIDCSRILRAGFYNSKGSLEGDKYFGKEVYKVEQLANTERRYSLEQAFWQLGVNYTPNKRPLDVGRFRGNTAEEFLSYQYRDEHQGNLPKEILKDLKSIEKAIKKSNKDYSIEQINLKELYPQINTEQLPEGAKQMLYGFREGNANNVLMFLTLKLRYMGYTAETIITVIKTLAELDTFDYEWTAPYEYFESEVARFYYGEYKQTFRS
ncbi:MAG: hypothetical protein RR744_09690 [Cellulosilyticaceae bacterium]